MCMELLRTNIELDRAKLEEVKRLTGLKTAKETVDFALERLRRTALAFDSLHRLAGRIRFRKGYSYKKSRG